MPSKKHLHTYERRKKPLGVTSNSVYYRCIDPDCSHRCLREDLFGKRAACPLCGEAFILDPRNLRNKLPHCGCKNLDASELESIKVNATPEAIMEQILKLKQEKFNDDATSE